MTSPKPSVTQPSDSPEESALWERIDSTKEAIARLEFVISDLRRQLERDEYNLTIIRVVR